MTKIIPPTAYHSAQAKPEYILCAAIWIERDDISIEHQCTNIKRGIVMCGRRHCNIIEMYFKLCKEPIARHQYIQGFITSQHRFLNRREANELAIERGQVVGNESGDELISEDLY